MLRQLQKHLSDNSILEIHPSVYRKDHSTGTAVLSVLDCLLVKTDVKLVSDSSVTPQRSVRHARSLYSSIEGRGDVLESETLLLNGFTFDLSDRC